MKLTRDEDNVPYCDEDCQYFDGKRCGLLGHRPYYLCFPEISDFYQRLGKDEHKLNDHIRDD